DWSSDVCSSDLISKGLVPFKYRIACQHYFTTVFGSPVIQPAPVIGRPVKPVGHPAGPGDNQRADNTVLSAVKAGHHRTLAQRQVLHPDVFPLVTAGHGIHQRDRKSTRLNSSHV